jgi:hypothetical protein
MTESERRHKGQKPENQKAAYRERELTRCLVERIDDQERNIHTRVERSGLLVPHLHCPLSHMCGNKEGIDTKGDEKKEWQFNMRPPAS